MLDLQKLPYDVVERIIRRIASAGDPITDSFVFAMFVTRSGDDHDQGRFRA